jgi:hypothetical protein
MTVPITRRTGLLLILTLALWLSACTADRITPTPTRKQVIVTAAPALPTETLAALATVAPAPPTQSPTPATPAAVTPEILACPVSAQPTAAAGIEQLLYVNGNSVWQWDTARQAKTKLALPEDASDPVISADGQMVAFLKQDEAVDTPEKPVPSLPLRFFDRQTGVTRAGPSFSTDKVRKLYPSAPSILLKQEWLPGGHWLLVQVYPAPWGEGMVQPTGPLYLVDADAKVPAARLILAAGSYEVSRVRPDGGQIAALDTAAFTSKGKIDFKQFQTGALDLISVAGTESRRLLPVKLSQDGFGLADPHYAPNGERMVFNVENGLAVVDSKSGTKQEIPVKNACQQGGICYWANLRPVDWLPDSQSFYMLQTTNDFFDNRADTTLSQVNLLPAVQIQKIATIHANLATFSFSHDRKTLSFWNQIDADEVEKNPERMNWVTLQLIDLRQAQPKGVIYTAQYILRIVGWNPDNQRFLYTYSLSGGDNPVGNQLALGNICQVPKELPVPQDAIIDRVQWLNTDEFVAWTLPTVEGAASGKNFSGLYLFDLNGTGTPVHIDDFPMDLTSGAYGTQQPVVVVSH